MRRYYDDVHINREKAISAFCGVLVGVLISVLFFVWIVS